MLVFVKKQEKYNSSHYFYGYSVTPIRQKIEKICDRCIYTNKINIPISMYFD